MQYNFLWDRKKAYTNRKKHGVTFRQATEVFNDPLMMTMYDEEHNIGDERWITLGRITGSKSLVVVHTYHEQTEAIIDIRIISARPATKHEIRQYEGG